MPEPEPVQQPAPAPAKAKRKRAAPTETAVLAKLRKKYRLDDIVRLEAEDNNKKKLGRGPLMDPEVFTRLASIDPTPDKRYLDWMLFQAGGGAPAFKLSLEMWGDGTKELTPAEFMEKFSREVPIRISANNIDEIVNKLRDSDGIEVPQLSKHTHALVEAGQLNTDAERFAAVMAVLNNNNIGTPENRERIARELLSHKLKKWIRNQNDTKVRDRVHAVFIFNRMAKGMGQDEAEAAYRQAEPELKREYVFGDQDNLRYRLFGFYRHWPGGKEGVYEKVYNVVKEFLNNKVRVEHRNTQLDRINANIQAKNASLPPEDQLPLREPIDISLDIGKVTLDRTMHLKYSGAYPTIQSLATANEQIIDLPLRERVQGDIRYAGPKSKSGPREKLYSDQYLDVVVPLTVAAAVKSGHKSWNVSDPSQLDVRSSSTSGLGMWTRWAAGQHGHAEWQGSRAVPVYFIIKDQGQPVFRVMLVIFMADLVSLKPPYHGTLWQLQDSQKELHFIDMVKELQKRVEHDVYINAMRSIGKALKVLRDWGQEFDPEYEMVGDYLKFHREGIAGKRGLREEILIRARQIVELLTE